MLDALRRLAAALAFLGGATAACAASGAGAAIDANSASPAELQRVPGIGPAISARIVEERTRGGPFRDLADLEQRVAGIGPAKAAKMSAAGLAVSPRGGAVRVARSGDADCLREPEKPPAVEYFGQPAPQPR